jgi:DNA-binding transcriptional ArsR family regulator
MKKDDLVCSNQKSAKNINLNISKSEIKEMAYYFSIFSDITRLKIIYILSEINEVCVCNLAPLLKISRPAAFHQLTLLEKEGLLNSTKVGKFVYYSLKNKQIRQFIESFLDNIKRKE